MNDFHDPEDLTPAEKLLMDIVVLLIFAAVFMMGYMAGYFTN